MEATERTSLVNRIRIGARAATGGGTPRPCRAKAARPEESAAGHPATISMTSTIPMMPTGHPGQVTGIVKKPIPGSCVIAHSISADGTVSIRKASS